MTLVQKTASRAADAAARQTEHAVMQAIQSYCNAPVILDGELLNRMHRHIYPDGSEIYGIDGVDVIWLGPLRAGWFHTDRATGSITMTLSRKTRSLQGGA